MKISVIIPCYNEEQTILKIIRAVQEYLKGDEYEIIIVDDASKDNSTQLIEECLRNGENLKLICHEHNSGKGAAIRTGFNATTGDLVVIQDADLEYDPTEFSKLFKPIQDGKADVVHDSKVGMPQESYTIGIEWGMFF